MAAVADDLRQPPALTQAADRQGLPARAGRGGGSGRCLAGVIHVRLREYVTHLGYEPIESQGVVEKQVGA
jgi:hypothetical protein